MPYAKQPEQDANANFVAADPITGNTAWSVRYLYDDNGNIVTTTDARGVSVTGSYDALNRLKVRDYSDATPDVSFYYDGKYLNIDDVPQTATGSVKGKTTGVKSSVSRTNYTGFDTLGRLLTHQQITDGQTYGTSYIYNLSGGLISETYPSGRTVNYDIDADGDLSRVWGQKGSTISTFANAFNYDASGAVRALRLGNGKWETAQYNNRMQITQIGLGKGSNDASLLKLEYGYGSSTENNGNLREQKITVPNAGGSSGFTATQTYTYDDLDRLQVAEEKIAGGTTWKQAFAIDRYGNRRFDAANTTTLGSCPQAVCNPAISTASNRFSPGQGYAYDPNGNVTQDAEGKRFSYDAENHQKEFFAVGNASSTPDATYSYDGDGRRVKKTSTTETTVFVYNASGQLVAEYSTVLAQTQQVSYLTTDHLGSPRVVTNQLGAVRDRKDFTAFGEENFTAQRTSALGYSAPDNLRKGYTGYEKDAESGLDFAQARYYNSVHGRYTSVDPLTASASIRNPQTFNRYSYVLNSPYKFTDPLGLLPLTSAGACGQWCNNSIGGYVDGSAFRGRDTSIGANMLEMLTLEYNVERAIQRLASADFNNQFTSNVSARERIAIKNELDLMLKAGDNDIRNLAAALVNNGTMFDVVDNLGNSASVGMTNADQLNRTLREQSITPEYAFRFFKINLDRTSWQEQPDKWKSAFVGSNIIHEATHIYNSAWILASWSGGGRKIDVGLTANERAAKETGTRYLINIGGEHVKYGQMLQYIDAGGKLDHNAINAAAGNLQGNLSAWLRAQGAIAPR